MKLSKLLQGTNAKINNDIDVCGITSDSRKVQNGSCFVCIKGPISDGHDYAIVAVEQGASVVITERDLSLQNQIIVEDTRELFFKACGNWFNNPLEKLKLIGVTGTNGKTSVSYMTKAILEKAGYKCGLIGTIQHLIGDEKVESSNTTPGAYELNELFSKMVDAGCSYAVMEVSSHALDQKRICGVLFEASMFTNLTQDHLDYHKTMENYLEAKKKLFEMSKKAILNYDDEASEKIAEDLNIEVITYSALSDEATYSAKGINYRADGVDFDFVGYGIIGRAKLKTGGRFTVYNGLCALSLALSIGIPLNTALETLRELDGVKGRAEVVPTGRDFHVIIDYAHTPDGLQNILETFREIPKNRLIALFGCGGDRDKSKRAIMGKIASRNADFVIVTSDNPRTEKPLSIIKDITSGMSDFKTPYVVIENRIEAIKYAISHAVKDDIIVLAGKGHEDYQILGTTKIHLDEREVVKEALEEL